MGDNRDEATPNLLTASHLDELVPDIRDREVILCGPPGMVGAIRHALREVRVPRRNIHLEEFAFAP